MSGLMGLKSISFSAYKNFNKNSPTKDELNLSLQNKPITDTISFEGKRHYSNSQKKIMTAIRDISVKLGLPDFYSAKRFGKGYKPSIEHLHPFSQKRSAANVGLGTVNSLANFVPVESKLNSDRGSIPLRKWYQMHPGFLENGKKALKEYEKVNTPEINGKNWVSSLKRLLNLEMGYIAFTGKKANQAQNLSYKA